jgi:bifunctional DNA-binding transcriptional regulator/antitoxin component of YhaV-PrlF toxin-antitoxin module
MVNESYTSTIQRKGKQVYIPDTLLDVAEIEVGDYLEITIRKVKSRK